MRRGRWVAFAAAFAIVMSGWLAAQAGAFVYWTNELGNTIGRANLDGTGVNQSFITGASGPVGLAVDGQHVYWTDWPSSTPGVGVIARSNLDGSGVEQSFITGATTPAGVAVDGQHVYWTNTQGNTIGRANLDGSAVNQSFITGAKMPEEVTVDGQHVYWANDGTGSIGIANLDGSNVNPNFITGATDPVGVAVDGAHIYWTNELGDTIGRANLDGSGINQNFITGASLPDGLAVDAAHIYWVNFNNTIGRANLDGSSVDQSFITGTSGASGLAVDALVPPPTVSIAAPLNDATFTQGATVKASYSCADGDGGPGIASCTGTVANGAAIDTATPGTHTFTVTATSKDGQTGSASNTYTVTASPPTVSIATPLNDATFTQGATVNASYSCADGDGGPGIASCTGTVADGAAIDTATAGTHTFTVTATSKDGQTGSASNTYTVVAPTPPPALTPAPVLSNLHASHARWRAGKALARLSAGAKRKRPPVGTTFTFTLNVQAAVKLAFARKAPGRQVKAGGKRTCVAQTKRNRNLRKCTRTLTAGSLTLNARAATNKIVFQGRINSRRKLKPGTYVVTITATNATGSSRPKSLRFTIVK